MFTYLKTMLNVKMSEKGALFVEYALILAFVLVVGAVFLGGGFSSSITNIFSSASTKLSNAATSAQ